MLQQLIIRNYAIIDSLTLSPGKGLNIVTGETGAGKSIILGALSLILGARADSAVLIRKQDKCIVEAHFDVSSLPDFRTALLEAGLDDDPECIIRREISPAGKSRAFINDSPVTLNMLQELTACLVDLQQQWAHLELENDHFLLDVADAVAGHKEAAEAYRRIYGRYRLQMAHWKDLREQKDHWDKEADYKQFLYEELADAGFKENEIEENTVRLKKLTGAEKIISALQTSVEILSGGPYPVLPEMKKLEQHLYGIRDVFPDIAPLRERLISVQEELKDISMELEYAAQSVQIDPDAIRELETRMDKAYHLLKKHHVDDTAGLIALQEQLKAELERSSDLHKAIQEAEEALSGTAGELKAGAASLSAARKKAADDITGDVNRLLEKVGMPNARINLEVRELDEPGPEGQDRLVLLLDANRSGRFLPVQKAASGGEMSRIMLCVKSMTAAAMQMPTLVFDEVDTGISGEAARQVALLLEQLARYHQLICITHQPQVAARGETHLYVYKSLDEDGSIHTKIRSLDKEEKVLAVARMIGGEEPGKIALQHARELVETGV